MRERILLPLGLNDTSPEMPKSPRLATAYSAIGRDGRRSEVTPFAAQGIGPAAGFASTARDLARFASWQFRLLDRKSTEVLSPNTLREMHRVHWIDPDFATPWGLGFAVWRDKEKTFVGHGGSCPGFKSQLLMHTPDEIAIVVMANAQGVDTGRLAQRAYEIIGPVIKTAAKADAPAKALDSSLEQYTGTYASGFGGEVAVFPWEDGLGMIGLPSTDPMAGLVKWKKAGAHTFRRMRKDETLAETLVFEMPPDGKAAARIIWHDNRYTRVKSADAGCGMRWMRNGP